MAKAKVLDDPFAAILAHLDDAATHVEQVYILDKAGAFADKNNEAAAQLAKSQLAKAAALLRDLAYTSWIESAKPATGGAEAIRSAAPTRDTTRKPAPRLRALLCAISNEAIPSVCCGLNLDCYAATFRFSPEQVDETSPALTSLYDRTSGESLVAKVWAECAGGINHVIDVYTLGSRRAAHRPAGPA